MVVVETVTPESLVLMSRIWGYDYCLGSDLVIGPMAEDDSRTSSMNEPGSGSKDAEEEREERWLQLGLGGYTIGPELKLGHVQPTAARSGLVELELLPGSSSTHVTEFRPPPPPPPPVTNSIISAPLFMQHPRTSLGFPHSEVTWGYRPNPWNPTAAPSSSSVMLGPYLGHPFQHQNISLDRPSSDVRVIEDPRRPHTGVWFILQASQNQAKEPFLPQIQKSYLRIKDGRMTVRLLVKYLVNKLRLSSESEIEVTCRGQQLLPFLTLQHVRDNIWRTRDAVTLLPDSSTTDHIMILHYGRIA